MGAYDFRTRAQGASAEEAFRAAVDRARYESGHGGYTGTIAEKAHDGFVTKRPHPGETVDQLVERTLDDNQKWGAAFCVLLEEGFREVEERHAQPVTKERVQRHPHSGTRRWQTVFVLYQDEEMVPKVDLEQAVTSDRDRARSAVLLAHAPTKRIKTAVASVACMEAAERAAQQIARRTRKPVRVELEKHLVGSSPLVRTVTPELPPQRVTRRWVPHNTYLFYGYASS